MKKVIKEKSKGLIKEFKIFIQRGNVMDLAVGVIIGGAFGKIVTSLVDDILMPLIGIFIGGLNFDNLSIKIGEATIKYGSFINNVINFLIIAFCIFIIIKLLNKLEKKQEKTESLKKSDETKILEEILSEIKQSKKH